VIRLVRGVCRLTGTPINRSIEHGLHGARSRALFFTVHPRAAWETSAAQGSSRCLDLEGGALLFAYARFGRCDPDAPSSPAGCYPIRNRARALRRGDALRRPGC